MHGCGKVPATAAFAWSQDVTHLGGVFPDSGATAVSAARDHDHAAAALDLGAQLLPRGFSRGALGRERVSEGASGRTKDCVYLFTPRWINITFVTCDEILLCIEWAGS